MTTIGLAVLTQTDDERNCYISISRVRVHSRVNVGA